MTKDLSSIEIPHNQQSPGSKLAYSVKGKLQLVSGLSDELVVIKACHTYETYDFMNILDLNIVATGVRCSKKLSRYARASLADLVYMPSHTARWTARRGYLCKT